MEKTSSVDPCTKTLSSGLLRSVHISIFVLISTMLAIEHICTQLVTYPGSLGGSSCAIHPLLTG